MRGGGSVKAAHQRRDESSSARASSAAGRSEFRESAHTRIHLAVVKAERAPRLDVHLRLGLRGGRCRGRRGRLRRHRGVVGPHRRARIIASAPAAGACRGYFLESCAPARHD